MSNFSIFSMKSTNFLNTEQSLEKCMLFRPLPLRENLRTLYFHVQSLWLVFVLIYQTQSVFIVNFAAVVFAFSLRFQIEFWAFYHTGIEFYSMLKFYCFWDF